MAGLKLIQPQEVEVLYILPTIRRELTIQMKFLGKGQKEIANLLSVTESAVSQYLKSKRAVKIVFDAKSLKAIKESAGKITDTKSMLEETQRLLTSFKESGFTCKVHKDLVDLPENCNC